MNRTWFFTDLDGTLIPLQQHPETATDLEKFRQLHLADKFRLVYVTGRHFASACEAIETHNLPTPSFLICNVGTEIYRGSGSAESTTTWHQLNDYSATLSGILQGWTREGLERSLAEVAELRMQEPEKLSSFKLSYYVDAEQLASTTDAVATVLSRTDAPFSVLGSVDPFNGNGLIDLLPQTVDKAYAVRWIAHELNLDFSTQVIYAGDSGNDLAMLTANCRAIIVSNATEELRVNVMAIRSAGELRQPIYPAESPATSGVLEGLMSFLG
jgi:sucrose-6F-phosphate phosphohydrolase